MTDDDQVGSAAEEAAKLLSAFAEWARERQHDWGTDLGAAVAGLAIQASDGVGAAAHEVDAHLATGAEECRYCPVCRAVQVYRSASPEVREHLRTAATSLAQAAAAMLATAVPDQRSAGVEHIDLTDDWPDREPAAPDPEGEDGDGDGDEA